MSTNLAREVEGLKRMEAENLARRIAQGDRSQSTATAYARSLGVDMAGVRRTATDDRVCVYSLSDDFVPPLPITETSISIHGVFATGATPEEAIRALARAKGWGRVARMSDLEGGDPVYTWGRRFTADGTGFKAAGQRIPGGYVVTWWK